MTTTLLGKVVITPRGAYNSATAYVALDAITYSGSSYLALQPVTGVTPTNDGVNYQLLAQAGTAFLAGSGAPSNALGNDGDSYLDEAAGLLYGPKVSGVWPGSPTDISAAVKASLAAPTGSTLVGYGTGTVQGAITGIVHSANFFSGLFWGFLGDSITAGTGASNWAYSFGPQAIQMASAMVARPDSYTNGVAGNTAAQMLARISTFLGYGPGAAVLLAGTNDCGITTVADYITSMQAIIQTIKQTGIPLILCTIPPRSAAGGSAAVQAAIVAFNSWIRFYGATNGCEVADLYNVLVDVTTGYYLTAYDSGDGKHPSTLGHQVMGVEVAKAMKRVNAKYQFNLLSSVIPAGLLTADPLNARATPTTAPWFEWPGGTGTAPAYSMVNDTSGVLSAGRWAQMDFDGTALGGTRILAAPSNTSFAVGDMVSITGQIQIEDVSGTFQNDIVAATALVNVTLINQSGVTVAGFNALTHTAGIKDPSGYYDLGPMLYNVIVPAGTTGLDIWVRMIVPTGKHYKMRVGCVGLLNLTTLGINASNVLGFGNQAIQH